MGIFQCFLMCFCLAIVSSAAMNKELTSLISRLSRNSKEFEEIEQAILEKELAKRIVPVLPKPLVLDDRRYKRNGPTVIELSITQKKMILEMHNNARASVVPAASPELEYMDWNNQLADIAHGWALQCTWGHNPDRSAGVNGYVGENLAVFTNRPDNEAIEDSMNGWIDEKNFYNYQTNSCQPGQQCGHYTQVVWRQSNKVGCALVLCPEMDSLVGFCQAKFFVCNYYYGGNWDGHKPY